jgi:hypothetical protein
MISIGYPVGNMNYLIIDINLGRMKSTSSIMLLAPKYYNENQVGRVGGIVDFSRRKPSKFL